MHMYSILKFGLIVGKPCYYMQQCLHHKCIWIATNKQWWLLQEFPQSSHTCLHIIHPTRCHFESYKYVQACIHVHTYTYSVCVQYGCTVCICSLCKCRVHVRVCACVCTFMCACVCTFMCACVCTFTCTVCAVRSLWLFP